jgi:HAD superfamily hydrolase (TIGR01509 family)
MARSGPVGTLVVSSAAGEEVQVSVSSPARRSQLDGAMLRATLPVPNVLRLVPEDVAAPTPHAFELDSIATRWQLALDAAQRALGAAGPSLPALELARRQRELAEERRQTADLLVHLAGVTGVRPAPWLSPVPVSPRMLGLPPAARACLFDLDGVLTDSAVLHAWAWGEVLDEFLLRLSEKAGWHFIPFDRGADYRTYIDGRSRLEGVHGFLASRGISGADTALTLATRKAEMLARGLRQHGVNALDGARRYLEAAGHAGLERAVISSSANTAPMLERAGLATLLEARIDAEVIRTERLRSRPAPDLLLAACRRLDVHPADTVTFTHSAAGVAAGRAAGLAVVGIGDARQGEVLEGFGADRVVPSLGVLLDPRLASR